MPTLLIQSSDIPTLAGEPQHPLLAGYTWLFATLPLGHEKSAKISVLGRQVCEDVAFCPSNKSDSARATSFVSRLCFD